MTPEQQAAVGEPQPYVTLPEYYMGRDVRFAQELSDAHKMNAERTVEVVNRLLTAFGEDRAITSGWRPASVNASTKGAAPHSKHVLCQACDVADPDGTFGAWCLNNLDILEACGAWIENPAATPSWVHIQTVPPASGRRYFNP